MRIKTCPYHGLSCADNKIAEHEGFIFVMSECGSRGPMYAIDEHGVERATMLAVADWNSRPPAEVLGANLPVANTSNVLRYALP